MGTRNINSIKLKRNTTATVSVETISKPIPKILKLIQGNYSDKEIMDWNRLDDQVEKRLLLLREFTRDNPQDKLVKFFETLEKASIPPGLKDVVNSDRDVFHSYGNERVNSIIINLGDGLKLLVENYRDFPCYSFSLFKSIGRESVSLGQVVVAPYEAEQLKRNIRGSWASQFEYDKNPPEVEPQQNWNVYRHNLSMLRMENKGRAGLDAQNFLDSLINNIADEKLFAIATAKRKVVFGNS